VRRGRQRRDRSPDDRARLAKYIMTGDTSWYLERLPLSRFDDESKLEQHHKVTYTAV
jgi:hypothetical protein